MIRLRFHIFAAAAVAALATWPLMADQPTSKEAEADPYAEILKYADGQSRQAQTAIEAEIRKATAEQREVIEGKLLAALRNEKATTDCKRFICRKLKLVGTERSVAPLAALLADKELSHMARFALEGLAGEKADAALREALSKVEGELKIGVITTIGARRDGKAVPALAKLAGAEDAAVAKAAIAALGHIGSPKAADALQKAAAGEKYRSPAGHALLTCAETMESAGDAGRASAIYHKLFKESEESAIRIAALRGILMAEKGKAIPLLLSALAGHKDAKLQEAAGQFVAQFGDIVTTKTICARLPSLPPEAQAVVLSALAVRGDAAALPAVLAATRHDAQAVRIAAIGAVSELGGAGQIDALLDASSAGRDEAGAVQAALVKLRGGEVDKRLIEMVPAARPPHRRLMIGALAERNAAGAAEMLLKVAGSAEDRGVRSEALKALRKLARPADLTKLVALLVEADSSLRPAAAGAVVAAASRIKKPNQRAEPIVSALAEAPPDAKCALLGTLGKLGGPKALEAVRNALAGENAKVKDAAVRAMAEWPDASPADDLLKIARGEQGLTKLHRILALRGYIRAAGLPGAKADKKLAMLEQADELAERPEEKKLILSALGELKSTAAFEMAAGYLDDAALKSEAAAAALKIGPRITDAEPQTIEGVCNRIKAMSISDALGKQADEVLDLVKKARSYIHAWQIAGPYARKGKNAKGLMGVAFPPEQADGSQAKWRIKRFSAAKGQPWMVNINEAFPGANKNKVVYLRVWIHSDDARPGVLELGSDDGVKVWLNGKVVHENNVIRHCQPAQDKVKVNLNRRANSLMLKVTQTGGGWAVAARLTDPKGKLLTGVKMTARPPEAAKGRTGKTAAEKNK